MTAVSDSLSRPALPQRRRGHTARPGLESERWHGYLFIAPAFIFLCAVIVLPLIKAFWTSLERTRGLNTMFVGFDNYVRVLESEAFWNSLWVSLSFTALCVAMHMAIGLGLAMLLNRVAHARAVLRVAFLTPWMVAPAIGSTIWLWLLEPQFGVVNYLFSAVGLIDSYKAWLGEPSLAFGSIVAVDVWRGVPFVMLLLLAGLQTIPVEQYEAASIDGASPLQQFRYITLPNLKYFIVVASTLDIINTIRMFDIIAVMTGGGPVGATEVLPALLYNTAFRANHFGEAAAIGVLLLILVLAFSVLYVGLTRTHAQEGSR
ncbi:MAG: sugar ABC transporter permease [Chelatococcus sp.]|uniref:carbohydrate ABC transporter permease n=1 Tax=unclassified Chelatococcus TaxID=2638111 RepID=UPI001BCE2C7F|nr:MULTISPECIES: sugar ABC transporter permease [unclassified Chelatococcus]CAH1658612.1 Trehalose/maltose transport system permease protein MalF [Hyphomicrobiales bacterium]MBS7742148.1 sugar ABC transporter permease [Chelatococcus sp. HY11]MBX3538484.1 sugar ABC transporter permease [Chelatococcus sp.]MBX3542734.1 sugar ABC transporter permease [Chelatococcus sp.]MCO5075050.1 sugar ABC transporter permease [Chelatococcus sp.]